VGVLLFEGGWFRIMGYVIWPNNR